MRGQRVCRKRVWGGGEWVELGGEGWRQQGGLWAVIERRGGREEQYEVVEWVVRSM